MNKKKKKIEKLISLLLTVSFILMPVCSIEADLVEEIENKIEEANEVVKNLENQAEEYSDIIKDLRTQVQSLENEIELFDAQIAQLDLEIQTTEAQIEQTNLEIENLSDSIVQKEEEIENQKETLKKLLRKIKEYDSESLLEILLNSSELSEFFNQSEYVNTIGEKVKEILDNLNRTKQELEEKKEEEKEKKAEFEELSNKLLVQKEIVDAQKDSKELLLKETKGKEDKYQDLLFNVGNQKKTILGDINRLKRDMEVEIAKIAAMAERPSENLASTSWYFSQNDPQWKDMTIGLSNSTIDDYGCAIASVAMVYTYYGIEIDPGRLSKQPIFYRDLISWPSQWRYLDLVKRTGHNPEGLTKTDWNLIDREIANGHPVIVFIKALGRGAGHYVVIHTKDSKGYVVHDPVRWNGQSGANIYLATTQKYLSSIYKTNTIIDQMIIYN
ncbi:MAG: C39 family peptidase [Candidatus Pacebacteria bacterium]|nr:C39 family peptidase [Candidatus Paceibacterota bacterium]